LKEHTLLVNEYRIGRPDGQIRWINALGQGAYDDQGRAVRMAGICIDITERKRVEEALRENERRLQQALVLLEGVTTGTDVIIAAQDTSLRYTFFNKAYQEEMKRLTGKDIHIGTSMAEVFADLPEQHQSAVEEWSLPLRGQSTNKTIEFGDPGRHRRVYNVLHTPIRDAAGNVVGAGEVATDVTEQVRTQQALRESEERYRSLFNGMTEGFALHEIICDENGKPCDYRFLEINPSFERLTGLKREDVVSKLKSEVLPNDDPYWVEIYGAVALTGQPIHFENYSSALNRHYDVFAHCPAPHQFAVLFMNITERKQAEEALRQSEEKYRMLFETMVQGVVYQDAAGKIISANPAAERILGLTLDQMQGRTFMDPRWRAIHEDGSDFPGETHPALVALQTRTPVKNVAMGILDPQAQEYRWININAVPQFKPGEKRPYQVYATLADITERKRAEEELRETRDYLENLFNYANAPIIVWDPEFRITRFNHAFEHLTGRSAAEVLGQHLDILFPAGRRDEALGHIRRTVAGERWEVV
jgi:PAS domain S-box-containing protein